MTCLIDALNSAGLTAEKKGGAVLVHGLASLPPERRDRLKSYLKSIGGHCIGNNEVRCMTCLFAPPVRGDDPAVDVQADYQQPPAPCPPATGSSDSVDARWIDYLASRGIARQRVLAIGLEIHLRDGGAAVYQDAPTMPTDLMPKPCRTSPKAFAACLSSAVADGLLTLVPSARGRYYIPSATAVKMTDDALDATLKTFPW